VNACHFSTDISPLSKTTDPSLKLERKLVLYDTTVYHYTMEDRMSLNRNNNVIKPVDISSLLEKR